MKPDSGILLVKWYTLGRRAWHTDVHQGTAEPGECGDSPGAKRKFGDACAGPGGAGGGARGDCVSGGSGLGVAGGGKEAPGVEVQNFGWDYVFLFAKKSLIWQ